MTNQFEIGIEDPTPDEDGVALGFITVGDFHEHFPLLIGKWSLSQYQSQWREALTSLVNGTGPVALMCEMCRTGRLAWVLYREGDHVFIRQVLFVPGARWLVDADGQLIQSEPREIQSEDGESISEWRTDINAIKDFMKSQME